MSVSRKLIAVLMLLAWLSASAHVAIEHGGKVLVSHLSEAVHGHHHHHHGPAPGEEEHHHDLELLTTGQLAKAPEQQLLAPHWVPVCDRSWRNSRWCCGAPTWCTSVR